MSTPRPSRSRRSALATLAASTLAPLSFPFGAIAAPAANNKPWVIGQSAPLSGVLADTGRDMSTKYKETSEGGLAANLVLC